MTFSNHALLTDVKHLGFHLALAWVLAMPLTGNAALDSTPERPATPTAARTTPTLTERKVRAEAPRENRTYLAMVGPTALRFADAAPSLPVEPTLPTPQKPKVAATPETQVPTTKSPLESESNKIPASRTDAPPESANDNIKPVSILPDDTHQEIKAEDVLPFFQFPTGSDGGSVIMPLTVQQPAQRTVPPSTATYRQQ